MKKCTLISILLFPISVILGQSDYRPGFIVTLQNDTIYGEIGYKSNSNLYQSCRVRNDGTFTDFSPDQLIGFGFKNDKYFTSGIVAGAYVEELVRGALTLYKHQDTYFLENNAGDIYKLEEKDSVMLVDDRNIIYRSQRWRGIVSYSVSDCFINSDLVQQLDFNERKLTEIVSEYNKCIGSEYTIFKGTKPWTRIEFGLHQGIVLSNIGLVRSTQYEHLSSRYNTIGPLIGLSVTASSPRVDEKMAIQTGAFFSKSSYNSVIVKTSSEIEELHCVTMNISTIGIPLGLKYSLPFGSYSLQLSGGIIYDLLLESKAIVTSEYISNTVVKTYEEPAFELNKSQAGYQAGSYLIRSFKNYKAGFSLHYSLMSHLSSSVGLEAKRRTLSISIILQKV
jgi:hypothetical protein